MLRMIALASLIQGTTPILSFLIRKNIDEINFQEEYNLYLLSSETRDLKEFCFAYGVNYEM